MKIEKEKIIELWQEKMSGDISEENAQLLEAQLEQNQSLASELEAMEATWALFEDIPRPEPSPAMDARFEGMMSAYKENTAAQVSRPSLLDQLLIQIAGSWKMGLATLIVGLFIGWWILPSASQEEDMKVLSAEIQSMKEMMLLTLIEQPKAQERIRAVNLAAELPNADSKVVDALISTLNHDTNLNVRLAALESLTRYLEQAEVRKALINALTMQDSPLMLVAIADILVQIQEKSSLETMESLKESINDDIVKEKLEQSIQTLRQS